MWQAIKAVPITIKIQCSKKLYLHHDWMFTHPIKKVEIQLNHPITLIFYKFKPKKKETFFWRIFIILKYLTHPPKFFILSFVKKKKCEQRKKSYNLWRKEQGGPYKDPAIYGQLHGTLRWLPRAPHSGSPSTACSHVDTCTICRQ